MTEPLSFTVTGTPAPQGSHRGFKHPHTGRVIVTDDSKRTRPWRQDVKHAALQAIADREVTGDPFVTLAGPLHVTITFRLPRPKYHYGTGRNLHHLKPAAPLFVEKKPDIDKLVRSSLDALGEAVVWHDDAQVARLIVDKQYATGTPPGATILVRTLGAAY